MEKKMRHLGHDYSYKKFAHSEAEKVLQRFGSTWDGIKHQDIEELQERYGRNKIMNEKKASRLRLFIKSYITPFTLVLLALATISFFTEYVYAAPEEKDVTGVLIMLAMVILSGTMSFVQSVKSSNAVEKLQNMIKVTATVIRDKKQMEIPIEEVVCGDLVQLSAGDMIPADLRLIQSKDLFVSQSSLTGESFPIEKHATHQKDSDQIDTEYDNLLFLGTNVISGTGLGIVIKVGNQTLFGRMASDNGEEQQQTSFETGINKTTWVLIRFMLVITPTVFLINGLTKGDWVEALMFAIATAVGLTPEMLPMIVTTNLVKGSREMAKEGTIMKNVNAIQNFGGMDVLCTDKTGTLTQDKVILEYHYNIGCQEDQKVLDLAFLNSYFQTGLRNLMDNAVIQAATQESDIQSDDFYKVDEIPFDFNRRRMSVIIKEFKTRETRLITKGAVEEMLLVCTQVLLDGEIVPLTETLRQKITKDVEALNRDGLRVLAIADKKVEAAEWEYTTKDESELILQGYLAFLDPPKETAAAAIQALHQHNVAVKVLTGDNQYVTHSVCKEVGLAGEKIITGNELQQLNQEELRKTVQAYNIFAKITPDQKVRIVNALTENGQTVGFLGDGINDAGAMRAADVGISVDTAVDVAKESADVILLRKDLMVLEKGILSGRRVFTNTMKYVKLTASSNFGNVFSVIPASIFLPFLPIAPIQSLLLNLIYDTSCMSVPWDKVDEEYVEKPKKWEPKSIGNFMRWFGPTSSIFDIVTYLFMYFIVCPAILGGSFFELNGADQLLFIGIFHAGWFIESLWSQMLVLHFLRTEKMPFLQSSASGIMTLVTTAGIVLGTVLPFTAFGAELGFVGLSPSYFLYLIPTIVAYLALVAFIKVLYVKRYGQLL
ncbi:magnesium-translocating P-type ATPase [Enterococcus faecalis]|uniref:Magnesium-transporting ATPase, P-type 1 n=2 Tax=Enterococcus faecalis TaxID=1351 RepID=R3L111_ENTFL|nr:magnesium-translocating P-type ATPase [Enterococcus faecalis]EGO7734465.1 magnesium-translocating P-type ATPase [Enterococcus faecalis]EGO8085797.1 magnesium-translocating P-type ATPase [Enterococcus faecalis]EGO8106573.1 magnesium-translocating P-type ATPase [Enterococcus faecalis]EGO8111984.1 magnesium-translocating P-type ATPase [Enterococcus faecalis]EGO8941701.1 magnesium-translocating P-type ATPase [Enterococcus faecalis]